MQNIWEKIVYGSHMHTIAHIKGNSAQDGFECFINKAKKNKDSFENTASIHIKGEAIIRKAKEISHAHLILVSEQVLIKKVNAANSTKNLSTQVNQAFPNLNLEEFYYQILNEGSFSYIAIVRKQYAESIINYYESLGIAIINLSLGFSCASIIFPLIEKKSNEKLYASPYILDFTGEQITDFTYERHSETIYYAIGTEQVQSSELINIGAFTKYLEASENSNLDNLTHKLKQAFSQKKILVTGIPSGFAILFIILIINTLVFTSYYNKLESIRINQQQELTRLHQSQDLQKAIDSLKVQLSQIQPQSGLNPSKITNTIIAHIPEEIKLSRLAYQPLEKQIAPEKPLNLLSNSVIISGSTRDQTAITRLINNLETMKFTQEAILNNLQLNKGTYEFAINLRLE
ncbi:MULTISPECIES: hypothetical protein [Flavobacteriaceae]|jgi:hypothetical protein|uniref:hypothetical protein n=1 Tax=Flavobacteriaceae TaxID=49546 RepID=UPI000C959140|nr:MULTISPECIES: hypothetical protein [Flavobacteriaceae]MAG88514.1 hypothetical protein [Flavobacteriaceae bacterium]MAN25781.1 hypothetical protein [Mesonia sp.]MCC4230046.1 hypothetical protein [Zunongwangia profunda]|tara:strand:- start:6029 stop:7237 length:1209 start_codon:yes stop_codon:yes gene_type:complete